MGRVGADLYPTFEKVAAQHFLQHSLVAPEDSINPLSKRGFSKLAPRPPTYAPWNRSPTIQTPPAYSLSSSALSETIRTVTFFNTGRARRHVSQARP